jgi:tRNA(Ile)-lysidine synthase
VKRKQAVDRRVLGYIHEHALVLPGGTLLVGVSGGPDSVCLLHVLAGLRKALQIELHVAHLNHMLRGADSDADAEYVSSLVRGLGLPATIESRDVEAYRRERGLSLEEAAREVRYSFLAEVAGRLGSSRVAVGHTADDQVETVLMHLIRGTGLAGLRGMRPLSELPGGDDVNLIRPLLEITREETSSYCHARGLVPRVDQSNLEPVYQRTSVRLELLPLLRRYNADIETALLRTASAAVADMDFMEQVVSALWGSVASESAEGIVINKDGFADLHPALQRHVVRFSLRRLLGDLQDIEAVHIDDIVGGLGKPAGKRLSLPRGLVFRSEYGSGVISRGGPAPCLYPPLDGEHRLSIPGETQVGEWTVRATVLDMKIKRHELPPTSAYLDLDAVGGELTVRAWKRGDRFQPLGMDGTKKLHDFFVDEKVPREWRGRVPLVCSPQHIVWVVGHRIDQRAGLSASTQRILRLEFCRTVGRV